MNTIDENNYYYGFPISQAAFDAEMTDIMTEQYQLDETANRLTGTATASPTRLSGAAMRPWKTVKRSIRMSMR